MSHVEHARRSISPSSTHSDDSHLIYFSTRTHADAASASSAHAAAVDASLVSTKEIGGLGFLPSSTLSTSPARSGKPFHSSAASVSSTDDSTQEPCTPRDDNSIISPRLALAALIESDHAEHAVKDNAIQPAALTVADDRRESIFTVSAYLVNSPSTTWHSSGENTPEFNTSAFEPQSQTSNLDVGLLDEQRITAPGASTVSFVSSNGWSSHDTASSMSSSMNFSPPHRPSDGILTAASSFIESMPTQSTLIASDSSASVLETESSWGNMGALPNSRPLSTVNSDVPTFDAPPATSAVAPRTSNRESILNFSRPTPEQGRRTPSPARSVASTVTHDEEHGFIVSPRIHEHAAHASSVSTLHIYGLEKDFAVERSQGHARSATTGGMTPPPLPSRATLGRSTFRSTTQGVPTSVAFDSPPLSEGSPSGSSSSPRPRTTSEGGAMNFVLTAVESPGTPGATNDSQRPSGRGLGITTTGTRETEWMSRYAGAFEPKSRGGSSSNQHTGMIMVGTAPPDAVARVPKLPRDRGSAHARPRTTDSRPVLVDPRVVEQRAQIRRPRTASDMRFNAIPSLKSRTRPNTSEGAASNHSDGSTSNLLSSASSVEDSVQAVKRVSAGSAGSAGSSTLAATEETVMDVRLPRELLFLTTACIELWIDQEGFRAIRPAFYLVKATAQSAEFRTRAHENYVFHHAALDSAPVLRRLTVNHEESRDYLSRQANLTLKNTGTYTVDGTENRNRLPWQFKYIVQDRLDVVGRPMSGEKTFTPVSFTCEPHLLDPATRGKKVHLLHVMRKTVTPNLVATKSSAKPDSDLGNAGGVDAQPVSTAMYQQSTPSQHRPDPNSTPEFTGRPRAATLSLGQAASVVQQLPSRVIPGPVRPSTAEAASGAGHRQYKPTASTPGRPNTAGGTAPGQRSARFAAEGELSRGSRRPGTSAGSSSTAQY